MNALPESIEAHLAEAGFSPTEILILKRLLAEDAMTLRQLAAKTGKSTGVLDQAMKKLVRKHIVSQDWINDGVKFTIHSLESVVRWMSNDTKEKREMLLRRHQNFESFIGSLILDKQRPEIQFYNELEGLQHAYMDLLQNGTEMLQYFPVLCAIEDDPLRDFRVQYFRERRKKNIFSRIITHDTALGRRFQSRDPFEYRQTLLIPEDEFPFHDEKMIIGNAVACFNHTEKRACIIRYPEMANMERNLFESMWKRKDRNIASSDNSPSVSATAAQQVSLKIRTLSGLRDFFLSRKSIAIFVVFAFLSATITFGVYKNDSYFNTQRVKERAKAIAATAALQFEQKDIDQLHTAADITKPEYARVIAKLNDIRSQNENVTYMYILRSTKEKNVYEFVADADSLNPYAKIDLNGDGIIDEKDHLSPPGELYKDISISLIQANNENQIKADAVPYSDQWGSFISGYAPIRDQNNHIIAILGADIFANQISNLTNTIFSPLLYFIIIFLLFVCIRMVAFNRSLFKEMWHVFNMKKVIVGIALCGEAAFIITAGLYYYVLNMEKNDIGNKLQSIVATAAPDFNADDVAQLHFAKDMKTDAYQRVFQKLNMLRNQNKDIQFSYILRPIQAPSLLEFVADADSNYNLAYIGKDLNDDGKLDQADENLAPGIRLAPVDPSEMFHALLEATHERTFQPDQWGTWMSGFAPIKDHNGKSVAIVGVDTDVSKVYQATQKAFSPWLWFSLFITVFALIRLPLMPHKEITKA